MTLGNDEAPGSNPGRGTSKSSVPEGATEYGLAHNAPHTKYLRPATADELLNRNLPKLYVFQCGDLYKVGVSTIPGHRARQLGHSSVVKQLGLPVIPRAVFFVTGHDGRTAFGLESDVHSYLSRHRVVGEWFQCDLAEVFAAFSIFRDRPIEPAGPRLPPAPFGELKPLITPSAKERIASVVAGALAR